MWPAQEGLFVDFDSANALMLLGFDGGCLAGYSVKYRGLIDGGIWFNGIVLKPDSPTIAAPTHQQAISWLAKNKGVFISIEQGNNPTNYYPVICHKEKQHSHKYNPEMWAATPEFAIHKAIKFIYENHLQTTRVS